MENIEQIWEGRAGLARTYWGWGAASSIPWAIALSLVTQGSPAAIVLVLALAAYSFVLNIGIWRAANAYTGPVIWSALAKVSAAIGLLTAIAAAAVVVGVVGGAGKPIGILGSERAAPATSGSAGDEWWKKGAVEVR